VADQWELTILDADPPATDLGGLAVGDIDGDGHDEIVTIGSGGVFWNRPADGERGVIAEGIFTVGVTIGDVDGDGKPEVVAGCMHDPENKMGSVRYYKLVGGKWLCHIVDPALSRSAHDLFFADVDGDGKEELVSCNPDHSDGGLYIYKPTDDPTKPWTRHAVQEGTFAEGTAVGDVNGDGKMEMLFGPYLYTPPAEGAFAGPWTRSHVAPSFREMCRGALFDISGNGRLDAILAESEFLEGRIAWFENCPGQGGKPTWRMHEIDRGLYYAHSMQVRRDEQGAIRIFVAEMAEGGWRAPRNYDARLMEYVSQDKGKTWRRDILASGCGTHEAVLCDIDGDGEMEVAGKQWAMAPKSPCIHLWKKPAAPSAFTRYEHRLLDRDKQDTAIEILTSDVDGDGKPDVVCGCWWYRNGDWKRFDLPEGFEAIKAADIDGDGRDELIGIMRTQPGYKGLNSNLVWLKAIDPVAGKWSKHAIGQGNGDWPHGSLVAPLLPGSKLALVVGYHDPSDGHWPEILEIPDDPTQQNWPKRVLAEVEYGEEFVACDITGDGKLDIIAGPWWLENSGDGSFVPHRLAPEGLEVARVGVADVSGNGRCDVVLGEEVLDFPNKVTPMSRLVWLECPEDPTQEPWPMHVIDKIRCGHSIGVADLDGDGEVEIVCGEHDPFYPYRTRCRMMIYKKADRAGRSWKQFVLDDRFEHHDGAKIFEPVPGRKAILSHGWKDNKYVHMWLAPSD